MKGGALYENDTCKSECYVKARPYDLVSYVCFTSAKHKSDVLLANDNGHIYMIIPICVVYIFSL